MRQRLILTFVTLLSSLIISFGCAPYNPDPTEQTQLDQERLALTEIQQNLADLLAQQKQQVEQIRFSYPLQIEQAKSEIQNLTEILNQYRVSESDINQSANQLLGQQSTNARYAAELIDSEIQFRTEEMNRLQQLTPSSSNQDQIGILKQQVAELRAQRVDLSASIIAQFQSINNQAQLQKAEVRESQADVQNQIFSMRQEILQLQTQRNQMQQSSATIAEQIQQQQQALTQQQAKIKSLEESVVK